MHAEAHRQLSAGSHGSWFTKDKWKNDTIKAWYDIMTRESGQYKQHTDKLVYPILHSFDPTNLLILRYELLAGENITLRNQEVQKLVRFVGHRYSFLPADSESSRANFDAHIGCLFRLSNVDGAFHRRHGASYLAMNDTFGTNPHFTCNHLWPAVYNFAHLFQYTNIFAQWCHGFSSHHSRSHVVMKKIGRLP